MGHCDRIGEEHGLRGEVDVALCRLARKALAVLNTEVGEVMLNQDPFSDSPFNEFSSYSNWRIYEMVEPWTE